FSGVSWNTREVKVDSSGCMCATMLIVPAALIGPVAVTVSDGSVSGTAVFTVTQPNITILPTSGYKGETVKVTGSGWPSHSVVTLTFEGSIMETLILDSTGSFTTQITVPLTAHESNIIGASDNLGNAGPALIYRLKPPGLYLSPLSGLPGTLVQMTGFGFEPYNGVEKLRIGSLPISAPGLITNNVGTFTTTFEAPSLPEGGYIVTATVAGETLDACFTIIESDVWSPVDGEFPTSMETALASISQQVIRVWCFYEGEWRMYDPDDPLGSTLTGMISGRAYWVKVSEACTLIFRGLQVGWNNIGW
ncbi:MAG: hypothetical protein MUP21_11505, partial [Dehalococcoidia bacterium]|nr:hypothetical protein [Dehalococcoidia bacterium]